MNFSQNFSTHTTEVGTFKTRLVLLLVLVLSAFLIVGCSPQDGVDTADDASNGVTDGYGSERNDSNADNERAAHVTTDQEVTEANIFEFVRLGQFRGIEYDLTPVESVTDADIEDFIAQHLSHAAEMTDVTDRAVILGDTVNIDFEGIRDDVAFEGGTAFGFDLVIGSGQFIPGFEEQIIGHNVGDEFDIDITFPENYHAADLAGVSVIFRIKINAIRVETVPELTDEFVQDVLGLESVDEYRTMIREQLENERDSISENAEMGQVWNEIVRNATILQFPNSEVEFRLDAAINEFTMYAMMYGMELEDLISMVLNMSLEEFIEVELRPGAFHDVTQDLVLRAVAAEAGLTMTEEEFEAAVEEIVIELGFESQEQFLEINGEGAVRIALLGNRVIEYVMQEAVGR